MKDVLVGKVSAALRLSVESVRLMLRIKEPELTEETFRGILLDRPEELLEIFRTMEPQDVSEWSHEQLCGVMDDADYDPAVAARESESGLFLDLHEILVALRRKMHQEHTENKCLSPTANFLVAVDGSRQSYLAFELASRLRRQGQLVIINVDEELAPSRQLPQISGEFITEEYKAHCARLRLPTNRVAIACESNDTTAKLNVAQHILHIAERERVDFIVIGAHGKGGPNVDQVRHVPWEVLRSTSFIPTLVVPPAPVSSVITKQYVFVVAVDKSAAAHRCLNAVFKLMRPADILRVVHFYDKPVVGEFDAQPFGWYRDTIDQLQIDGVVDVEPVQSTSTVAESLQQYLSTHTAAYLVLGLTGEGAETSKTDGLNNPALESQASIGRLASAMLLSPRCTLCLCP